MKFDVSRNLVLTASLAASFAGLSACNKDAEKGAAPATQAAKAAAKPALPGFLKYVPADTPYVFANLEPAPKAVFDKMMSKLEPIMAELNGVLDAELAKVPSSAEPPSTSDKVGRAILEELKGKLNVKGLEDLGLSAQTRMVIYGIGVLPAIRMELKNPDAFRAAVARVEAKSGQKLVVTKTGDTEHWIVENGEGENNGFFAAGIQGNDLVLGMGPGKSKELYLPALFGATKPAATLEDGGALKKIIDDYKFTPHGAGYVDFKALAALFTEQGTGLNAQIVATMRDATDPPMPAECKAEIPALAANFPRAIFGYEEMNDTVMVADFVIESKPEIGKDLGALAVSVPGLTASPIGNPVFVFGLGIDLEKSMALIKSKAAAIQAAPYKCGMLEGLNELANNAMAGMAQPMPPFVNMIKGVNLVVKEAKLGAGMEMNPMAALEDGKAYLTIASPSPAELLGVAKVMLPPNLAGLVVAPDGKAVAIPTEGLPPFLKVPSVTMTSNALAITTGEGMQAEVAELLGKPAAAGAPLFMIGYHLGKVMAAMNEKMAGLTATLPPDQKAKFEADMARNKAVAEMIGLVAFSLHAGEQGISFKPRVHWN